MKLHEVFLFDGVDEVDRKRMISCFNIKSTSFAPGETICNFDNNTDTIGILQSGKASLVRNEINGNRSILETFGENDVFGEMLAFSENTDRGAEVICNEKCVVAFIKYEHITKRCSNACRCHTIVVENMFKVITKKTRLLSERIEVLSNRTIRDKLLCYFSIQSIKEKSRRITIPFSISFLADYICADRSAMTREIRNMCDDGLIEAKKREIVLLT